MQHLSQRAHLDRPVKHKKSFRSAGKTSWAELALAISFLFASIIFDLPCCSPHPFAFDISSTRSEAVISVEQRNFEACCTGLLVHSNSFKRKCWSSKLALSFLLWVYYLASFLVHVFFKYPFLFPRTFIEGTANIVRILIVTALF
ncbi:hypothetical protein PM082_024985 [Marasmius tenuissimus]|nr:hypothetical protein PM082_024985 [Marasmius tenuissimus]